MGHTCEKPWRIRPLDMHVGRQDGYRALAACAEGMVDVEMRASG